MKSMKNYTELCIEYWIGQGPCAVYQLIKWRKCKVNLCADETDPDLLLHYGWQMNSLIV